MKLNFNRQQIVFVVEVMISSFTSVITCSFAARHEDGSRDKEYRQQRKEHTHNEAPNELIDRTLWQLGWNLSILYAQLTDEGLGESDALAHTNLGATLEKWAQRFANGEIGIIPNTSGDPSKGMGTYNIPDETELAETWVTSMFTKMEN